MHTLGSTPSIPSQSKVTQKVTQQIPAPTRPKEETPAPTSTSPEKPATANHPITNQRLQQVWEDYLKQLETENRSLELTILRQTPRLEGSHTIHLTAPTQVLADAITKIREEIVSYLRQHLQNQEVVIRHTVAQNTDNQPTAKPYTPDEKFRHLAQKQPLLLELQRRLGLQPDM